MSDFMPVPSPSPGPSVEVPSQASDDKGLWGHIADVADFLFATKSLGRILTGEGGWGDLGMVGITAASFFIPPVRLLKFGAKPLESIIVHAAEVAASDTASITAKRLAAETAENARYLLENPGKHDELVKLADTANNAEIAKLNNLHAQADEFLTSGTVPEPPIKRVGDTYKEPTPPAISEDLKTELKAIKEAESTKTIDERIASGEDPNAPIKEAAALNPESDAVKYFHLTEEEIANYRAAGKSEEYIANQNSIEESLNKAKTTEPRDINPYAEKYPHVHPDVIAKLLSGSVDEVSGLRILPATEKKLIALNEAGKRAGYTAPKEYATAKELTAAETNKLDTVQAEFPVTAEGKPITRRMEDAMPEDLRTGNLNVDRTAWLISESKKLENFLKKKPANAGEIRATKDLWNKKANELQLKMNPDERIQANKLADQLTERSLADYKIGKDTLQRGVLDFDVSKETDLTKLTDTRTRLIDEWRAETNPDLKKGLAITGKKVSARIEELNKLPEVSSVVENNITGHKDYQKFISDYIEKDSSIAFEQTASERTNVTLNLEEDIKKYVEKIVLEKPGFRPEDVEARIGNDISHQKIIQSEKEKNPELISEQINFLKDLRNNGQVAMAIDPESLFEIIKSNGKFANGYELNPEFAESYDDMRKAIESVILELPHMANPAQRPLYGFISMGKDSINGAGLDYYGDLRVVFKPHVKDKTLFTSGDTFIGEQTAVPLTGNVPDEYLLKAFPFSKIGVAKSEFHQGQYYEAQIFDRLSIDDIAEIYYPDRPITPAIVMSEIGIGVPRPRAMSHEQMIEELNKLEKSHGIKIKKYEHDERHISDYDIEPGDFYDPDFN